MTHEPDIDDVALHPSGSGGFGLSLIWLVPLLAVIAALFVAWQNWSQKGPLIEVAFAEADGLEAGKTELRYRDIAVGLVEELRFSDNLASVIATIRQRAIHWTRMRLLLSNK